MSAPLTPKEFQVRRQMEDFCREFGRMLARLLPKSLGFAVLIFEFHGHQSSYVSNCDRADMIKALREQADVLERHEDSKPIKERQG